MSETPASSGVTEDVLKTKITEKLGAIHVEVQDQSGAATCAYREIDAVANSVSIRRMWSDV